MSFGGSGGSGGNISSANDVALSNPANGQSLVYNTTLGKWQNQTASTSDTTKLAIANNLSELGSVSAARANLGLGPAAVLAAGVAGGVATLDAGGYVPATQLPVATASIVMAANRAPTGTDGLDGDGWIDTSGTPTKLTVYPPKASGVWQAGYDVAIGASSSGSGNMNYRGNWAASTNYAANDVVAYIGGLYVATASFSSGSSFNPANWVTLAEVNDVYAGNQVAIGEETWPRWSSNGSVTLVNGRLQLTFFTARKAETKNNLKLFSAGNAAQGVTYAAGGVYQLAGDGSLTLLAQTTADTALYGSTYTTYTKALGNAITTTVGQRYAVGVLVTASTMPAVYGQSQSIIDYTSLPLIGASLSGQASLPSSIAAGAYSAANSAFYSVVSP